MKIQIEEADLRSVLEALEYISSHYMSLPKIGCMALATIEEALAQSHGDDEQPAQQQEPVGHGGRPMTLRECMEAEEPAQPKYRRGDRLMCLETEEYCVIHISGTDRQWVKFPDTYIGVYTNEQLAELFELLPKEIEPEQPAQQQQPAQQPAQQQEPVAWVNQANLNSAAIERSRGGRGDTHTWSETPNDYHQTPLYITQPHRKPLTDEQILNLVPGLQDCLCDPWDYNSSGDYYASIPKDMIRLARAVEAAHGIKGDA